MSAPSTRPSFFAELQRRRVYKVGVMYAMGGWLLEQVITQVFPIYEISTHVQRIFVGVIIAGFPVALELAWVFDITPAGIVRTAELSATGESPTTVSERRSTDRKLNYLLGVLLILPLGYIVAERTVLKAAGAGDEHHLIENPFAHPRDFVASQHAMTSLLHSSSFSSSWLPPAFPLRPSAS